MIWTKFSDLLPLEGVKVETKIDDGKSVRNECVLIRKGNLMFTEDMKMYVYYSPTHWKFIK